MSVNNTGGSPSTLTINDLPSVTSTDAGLINNAINVTKNGLGIQVLNGANTYSGVTTTGGGILSVNALANGSAASPIGQSSSAAANLVLDGGTLQFNNTTVASTDRLFTLGANDGSIEAASTSTLTFENSGAVVMGGAGARTKIAHQTMAHTS